jgi:hypothetical protein
MQGMIRQQRKTGSITGAAGVMSSHIQQGYKKDTISQRYNTRKIFSSRYCIPEYSPRSSNFFIEDYPQHSPPHLQKQQNSGIFEMKISDKHAYQGHSCEQNYQQARFKA